MFSKIGAFDAIEDLLHLIAFLETVPTTQRASCALCEEQGKSWTNIVIAARSEMDMQAHIRRRHGYNDDYMMCTLCWRFLPSIARECKGGVAVEDAVSVEADDNDGRGAQ